MNRPLGFYSNDSVKMLARIHYHCYLNSDEYKALVEKDRWNDWEVFEGEGS